MKLRKVALFVLVAAALSPAASAFGAGEPKGAQGVSTETANQVRSTLGSTVGSALDGDYRDLVDSLAKPDRDRIAKAGRDDRNIENVAQQFNDTWRSRFDESIDFESRDTITRIFSNAQITQTDDKRVQVQIPASHNLPPVNLTLSKEGMLADRWRIDAPDNLTGETLKSRLQNELQALKDTQQSWPPDRTNAEQYAAHRMLSTLSQG